MSTTSTSLADALAGEVLLPGTDAYDRARSVWNAMVDRRPAAIVRPTTAKEVAQAVTVARDRGLAIGVRCGGHSVTGLAVPEGGLMIDLSAMSGSRVDPERRRAWIGGGAKLGVLDRATEPFGLATTAGNVSHTGVGGLTLGGGMGWLARRLGLSCDNVEAYEVVTADGSVVRASADERPDLFWGLRGGGGNFGIVTEFEFRLHPLAGRTLLVELDVALEHARDAFRAWNALIAEAPREATLTGWAGRNADGSPRIILGYAWVGDPEAGRGYLARFRDIGPATAESVSELSYVELQSMDDVPAGPGRRRYWKGHYDRRLPVGGHRRLRDAARRPADVWRRHRRRVRRRLRLQPARCGRRVRGVNRLGRSSRGRGAACCGSRLWRCAGAVLQRSVRQCPGGRGRRRCAARVSAGEARQAHRSEGCLRSR
jgi:FAD/FMN-containing dehydrogenase